MSQLESDEVPFHDASAYFSEEEWKLLQEWQRELYRNVMKEIHQALISLGPLITTTVCSLRAKEKEQMFLLDDQYSETKHRIDYSPSNVMSKPDVMFKVNNEAPVAPNHPQDPEGREGNGCTGTVFPFLNTDLSLRKEEMVSISIDPLVAEMGESSTDPNTEMARYEVVSLRIKDEDEPYFMDHQESRRIKRTFSHSGDESRNRRKKVRDYIKRNVPCKTFTEAIDTMVLQNSNQETNTRCQMLPESYQEVGGEESKSREGAVGFSVSCSEKTPSCSAFSDNINAMVFPSSNLEAHSRSQVWPEHYQKLGVENTVHGETGVRDPVQANLHQGSPDIRFSDAYDEGERNLMNLPFPSDLPIPDHNPRVYACTEEDQNYNSKGEFTRKIRTKSRERPFPCNECEKSFFQKTHLITHHRIHSGEKPYMCTFCHKRFNRKDYMDEHVRIHTGERPYHCTRCEKSFFRKSHLNYHQRKHTQNIKNGAERK
ncbi:zinc finger protein 510-like isoform X1 [Ambystoma mexicanum]|uniref:zinc finger protein 510-like isoform X1 n=1 Tax=Ambystoma mexicanum TaxID=8296 RepID=UPI0037E8F932